MNRRRLLALALLISAPLSSQAATLAIDGKYGNEAGCHYARTGDSDGSDDFFLLTPESVTTAASYCEVKTTGKSKAGDPIFVIFSCQEEGEENPTDLPASVEQAGKAAYKIVFGDGSVWGPLKRCE
jgi:hypothetical protein